MLMQELLQRTQPLTVKCDEQGKGEAKNSTKNSDAEKREKAVV